MKVKKTLEMRLRGWLPKETNIAHANKSLKPRWRKPAWIALTLVTIIVLSSAVFVGAQTLIRYSNPQADVTASYFEKTLNCTKASVGDVVEVKVSLYWHGYIIPEFKRQAEIIDAYPENIFELVDGNNTYQYSGYGGGNEFKYSLKVISNATVSTELPKPRLYLDNVEIPLDGQSANLEFM
ncbi:MAG: hypothetical protein NWE95_10275 [Candidatus Bathyarchaeota archaeon]|nr:hypothetical protein [Candidatus Bathyarchaeota archaeon]